MSNWVGGLPPEPKAKEVKAKKAAKPASPPDGDHPKTFFGGAIPLIPPKLPKYKKEPPSKVKITGAGPPIQQEAPEPKAPSVSSIATPKAATPKAPPTPSPPQPLPPSPESEPTPQSYAPPEPPPPSPASEPTPQSDTSPPLPKRFPSVFDKKPKRKRKKSKKKPKPPPPAAKPVECDDDEADGVCGDEGEENLGELASIFAICYIPATRQGQGSDGSWYGEEKEDRSGFTSPGSGGSDDDVDDGPDIPPEVPSYKRSETFSGVFGKKIDARNLAELGPHGWHPSANAPDHIAEHIAQLGPHGWHRSVPDHITGIATDGPSEWDEWSGWHEPRSE